MEKSPARRCAFYLLVLLGLVFVVVIPGLLYIPTFHTAFRQRLLILPTSRSYQNEPRTSEADPPNDQECVPSNVSCQVPWRLRQPLNVSGEDVLVVLHIQKTGGSSLDTYLTSLAGLPCHCWTVSHAQHCRCFSANHRMWLLSRYSTQSHCGVHPDWTELQDCVDSWYQVKDVRGRARRRYHYVTMLRRPESRYISEWRHVRRGATWSTAHLYCEGRSHAGEVAPCYSTPTWRNVSLEDFVACRSNLATNRQTRMLADLSKVNCYNWTSLSKEFLAETLITSAKENLMKLSFFGITDELLKTQFLFENTFKVRFTKKVYQKKKTSDLNSLMVDETLKDKVRKLNLLDEVLYQFAKGVFEDRVRRMERSLNFTVDQYFEHFRDSSL